MSEAISFLDLSFSCLKHLFGASWKTFSEPFSEPSYWRRCRTANLLYSYITCVLPESVSHCIDWYLAFHTSAFLFMKFFTFQESLFSCFPGKSKKIWKSRLLGALDKEHDKKEWWQRDEAPEVDGKCSRQCPYLAGWYTEPKSSRCLGVYLWCAHTLKITVPPTERDCKQAKEKFPNGFFVKDTMRLTAAIY